MGRLYWRRSAGRGRVSAAVSKPNGSGFGYGPPPVRVTPPVFACCVPHGPILRYSDVRYRDSTEADTSHPSAVSAPLVNTGVSQRPLPGISEANTGVSDLRVTFVFSDEFWPMAVLLVIFVGAGGHKGRDLRHHSTRAPTTTARVMWVGSDRTDRFSIEETRQKSCVVGAVGGGGICEMRKMRKTGDWRGLASDSEPARQMASNGGSNDPNGPV